MYNHREADAAIKELAPGLVNEAMAQILNEPNKTITETSDYGFSQGRRIGIGTDTETYEVHVHLTVLAVVRRPERERNDG